MSSSPSNSTQVDVSSAQIAAIRNVVQGVATMADMRLFEGLERLFANPVRIDYTSAFGGVPESKSPSILMTQWAGLLPGFDSTRHQITNIEVKIEDQFGAMATADVVADHFLAEHFWQVRGSYEYKFVSDDDGWKVCSMTFKLKGEDGSRDVLGLAVEAASMQPVSYLVRQRTRAAVVTFLTSLEKKDMETFAGIWTDDAVQDMPYSPDGFPKRVAGRENLIKHYAGWPENSGKANFTNELVFYPMQDPEWIFAEYRGNCDIKTTGRKYEQKYGGLFYVIEGKIKLFREYYDPTLFAQAFELK